MVWMQCLASRLGERPATLALHGVEPLVPRLWPTERHPPRADPPVQDRPGGQPSGSDTPTTSVRAAHPSQGLSDGMLAAIELRKLGHGKHPIAPAFRVEAVHREAAASFPKSDAFRFLDTKPEAFIRMAAPLIQLPSVGSRIHRDAGYKEYSVQHSRSQCSLPLYTSHGPSCFTVQPLRNGYCAANFRGLGPSDQRPYQIDERD
jgi:hypothetical protein